MVDRSRLNLIVVQIFIASLMVALLGRLFYLQIADGPRYREAALNIQSRDIVTTIKFNRERSTIKSPWMSA